jgi:hypothetical protein
MRRLSLNDPSIVDSCRQVRWRARIPATLAVLLLIAAASCATPAKYDPTDAPTGGAADPRAHDGSLPFTDATSPDVGVMDTVSPESGGIDAGSGGGGLDSSPAPTTDATTGVDAAWTDSKLDAGGALDVTPDSGPRPNWMFTTSMSQQPSLGGLSGADATCMKRAQAANLAGTFVALLSTSAVDARSRLGNSRGWLRTDGKPFADTQQQLFSGAVRNPPSIDEFGKPIDAAFYAVFTGSKPDGTRYDDANTPDWTNQQYPSCRVGNALKMGIEWLSGFTISPCAGGYRLYCFEVGQIEPVP